MYLFTLDWPLKKNYVNCSISSALCIQHKYAYMHGSSNKFLEKPTSNPLMDQLHQIFFEFISKLLVRCWECCAKCAVHSLSHDIRVPLELKKKKRKEKQIGSMLQGICSVIDHKLHQNVGGQGYGGQWED